MGNSRGILILPHLIGCKHLINTIILNQLQSQLFFYVSNIQVQTLDDPIIQEQLIIGHLFYNIRCSIGILQIFSKSVIQFFRIHHTSGKFLIP